MSSTILRPHPAATPQDWIVDAAITGLLAAVTCGPHLAMALIGGYYGAYYGNPVVVFVTCLALVTPLVLRRHYPVLMIWLMGMAALMQTLVTATPTMSLVVIPIAVYSIARWVPGDEARHALWWGLFGSVIGPARWTLAVGPFYAGRMILLIFAAIVCFGCVVTPYAVGRRVREQAEADASWRRAQLERQKMSLAAQEQRVRLAEIDARQDIARELHDIVAHSLSVIIVQAEGGKALAAKKPEAAAQVLDTIAETGREALAEARRIVAVLRQDAGAADWGPAPTLDDIADLVARTGERIDFTESGERPSVSSAVALTAYRVVQEGLTNVLKHAGPTARAWVALESSPDRLVVTVTDDGAGAAVRSDGRGNGLRGMRERVDAMGGTLEAGPREDGGFRVRAVLPATAGPSTGRM